MTVLRHEMKTGFGALMIWSVALSIFGLIALFMYPLVAQYSDMIKYLVERMGLMGQLFNLQNMNFYEFMTYYGLEYGNFMGLGGGMFAAVTGMVMVAKEEGRHTAEYLFSKPIGRASAAAEFVAMVLMVALLNLFCTLVSLAGISFMGQAVNMNAFIWFHVSLLMMNLQVAVLCFGISASRKGIMWCPDWGSCWPFTFSTCLSSEPADRGTGVPHPVLLHGHLPHHRQGRPPCGALSALALLPPARCCWRDLAITCARICPYNRRVNMAKLERQIRGDFQQVLDRLHEGIMSGSLSASFEEGSDWRLENVNVAVRVYERYSWLGSNRVSLSLTLAGRGEDLFLTAITSGGSQAVFFKINTFGESEFLRKLEQVVSSL